LKLTIKQARVGKNLTMAEMSEKLGTSQPTYSRWENGINDFPASKFVLFCTITDTNPMDIFLPDNLQKNKENNERND